MPRIAFVSYSHDSADHKAWVLRLATDLRGSGIDARLDRWQLRPGEEAGPFMARSVTDSEKIVVVCSETYVAKAEARIGGTGYESALVTAELVADQGTSKFIPILRDNPEGCMPHFLAGRIYVDFRADESYEDSLTTLLRALHDLPALDPPPIGVVDTRIASGLLLAPQPAPSTERRAQGSVDKVEELLQDPHRRIRLSKLLWNAAAIARETVQAGGLYAFGDEPTPDAIGDKARLTELAMRHLLPLLATMGRWATRDQIPSAAQAVAHFLDVPEPQGSFYQANQHLAQYPTLLALYASGLGALSEGRFDNLRALLFIGVPSPRRQESDRSLVEALHHGAAFAQDFWKLLPGKERRHTPASDHAFEQLSATLPGVLAANTASERLFDRLEAMISLAYLDATFDQNDRGWAPLGSYMWRDPTIVSRMQEDLARTGVSWPPLQAGFLLGTVERATIALGRLAEHLMRVRNQRGVF